MSSDGALNSLIPNIEGITRHLIDFGSCSPEAAADVPGIAAELYAIVASLRDVQAVSSDHRNAYDSIRYSGSVSDVVTAIRRTLRELDRRLPQTDRIPSRSRTEAYDTAWIDLSDFFYEQGHITLFERLNIFKEFLVQLTPILDGLPESRKYEHLHKRILKLLDIQEEDITRELRALEISRAASPPPPPKVKSWERKRPPDLRNDQPPIPPPIAPQAPPATGTFRPGPTSPISPDGSAHIHFPDLARPPSPPTSTTFSGASSVVSGPSATPSDMFSQHWINEALTADRPTTDFHDTGHESGLYDVHTAGTTESLAKNGYKMLMKFNFDSINAAFFLREKDHKSRLYCKYQKGTKKTVACKPLTSLRLIRDQSTLKLCQVKNKKNVLWVSLRFLSYEKLVLFFCAVLSLKMGEHSKIPVELDDHVLKGEKHVFSATIVDDQYRHALQIYKDSCSDGIRLQASVLKGEMKRSPVWVSFINYKIASLKWIKQVEPRKIHLKDMPRYVFMNDYTPRLGPKGEPELYFDTEKDAKKFMKVIEDLAEGRLDD